jgi:hypothetical protein
MRRRGGCPTAMSTQGFWMPVPLVKHLLNLAADMKPEDIPLTPWAKTIYQERIDNNGKDHPGVSCLRPAFRKGHPRRPEDRADAGPDRVSPRLADDLPADLHRRTSAPENAQPTWQGYSVGRWDGDTLVVDTIGQNGKTWLDMRGLPGTESLRVVERFTRPAIGRMEIKVTIDDPKAYTKPWDVSMAWTLIPDTDLIESICEENSKDKPHMVGK